MLIDILYYTFIFPLQSVLGFALDSLHSLTHNYGLSIILLSLLVNLFLLKLAKIAESKATKINALKSVCDKKIAEFKRVFKGAELQSYIRTLYRQKHYHPIFALSALGGLALQVPFFIAVLCLLQEFDGIKGVSFLWIADLSAPDSVLGVHLLPILMTIISLANVWIVAKERGAKIQGVLISLIFLVLLYQMPSALVLYWTTNMAFLLCKTITGKVIKSKEQTIILTQDIESQIISSKSSKSKTPKTKIGNFFILQKHLKITVIVLSGILLILLGVILTAKTTQHSALLKASSTNEAIIDSEINFMLRSKSMVSNVEIIQIMWDKSIDSDEIELLGNWQRYVYFYNPKLLTVDEGTYLGQISFKMNLTPLLKNLFKFYFIALGVILGIYLLLCIIERFQRCKPSNIQTYRDVSTYAILCIVFLICVFTPYQLYSTDIMQFDSTQTYATLSALFGAFLLISFIVIYALSFLPKRFSNIIAFILSVILFSGLVYSFILVGDYGAMDRFILQIAPQKSTGQIFECIAVLLLDIAIMAFALTRLKRPLQIILATLFIVSGVNAVQIIAKRVESTQIAQESNQSDKSKPPFADSPLFSYSKNEKNIVVLVLDAFSGTHTTHILEQFPEFKTQLDGFTLYPNTISSGASTIISITSLIAGEYYAGYNVNKRQKPLQDSMNEGFLRIGEHFADNNYNVGIYTTLTWINGYELFKSPKFFNVDNENLFIDFFTANNKDELQSVDLPKNAELLRFLQFGLFRFAPNRFKAKIYNNGNWHFINALEANLAGVISHASDAYAFTHIGNVDSTKPTFKFFHSVITHTPYGVYFKDGKCRYGEQKSAWGDYPHNVIMRESKAGRLYQHYDTEVCALSYLSDYIAWLKDSGIYDNTQIFVVSDHGLGNAINLSLPNIQNPNPDSLLLFKDFDKKGTLKIDNRLMANYDISSIYCANLKGGCPNVTPHILQYYPKNRTLKWIKNTYWELHKQRKNEWLIERAFEIKGSIYNPQDWTDISDESYGIVNIKK